jgi:hypothetical protein
MANPVSKLPLDISKRPELKDATLIQCVAAIIKHYGEEGCTMEDISKVVQKQLPQWKPTSASPCVSTLVAIGVARQESQFGVRRVFSLRDYDPEKDPERTSRLKLKHLMKEAVRPAPTLLISIAIGSNKTETLTMEEWRGVYDQLHQIFKG